MICDPEELRTLFLFEKLDDSQLAELCALGRIEYVDPGPVFREGCRASLPWRWRTGAEDWGRQRRSRRLI